MPQKPFFRTLNSEASNHDELEFPETDVSVMIVFDVCREHQTRTSHDMCH